MKNKHPELLIAFTAGISAVCVQDVSKPWLFGLIIIAAVCVLYFYLKKQKTWN